MSITAGQIIDTLHSPMVRFTATEIEQMSAAMRAMHSRMSALSAITFRAGDEVQFEARGRTQRGVVTKVNHKTVSVEVPGASASSTLRWKVDGAMLQKVA